MSILNFETITNFFFGSALTKLAANFTKVKTEFAKVLYRDGSTPMSGDLDMNNNRVINVGPAIDDGDLATVADVRVIANSIAKGPPGPEGPDYAYRNAVAASTGATLVGTKRTSLGSSAAIRTQAAKNADRFDLRDMNGLDLTGNNDNRSLMQTAINNAVSSGVVLYAPTGTIAVSDSLSVPAGFTLQGSGRSNQLPRTEIKFTGVAPGFLCGDGDTSGGSKDGFLFRDLVTSRIQPAVPTTGTWAPIDAAADFVMNGSADLDLDHVLLLNATRGVLMQAGGGIGRLNMTNVGGQVFIYGAKVEVAADTCKFNGIHWWPFWNDSPKVNAFSCANADHFIMERCDSPQFTNISSIACRTGVRFTRNSFGATTRAVLNNLSMDFATRNIWFDSNCSNASAWISNMIMQANDSDGNVANIAGVNPRANIEMQGTNDYLSVNGWDVGGASGPAIWIHGNSEECHLDGGGFVRSYGGTSGSTDGGLVATGNNKLILHTKPRVDSPGAGKLYDGDGYIASPGWRTFTPTITFGGSASGQVFSSTGKFRVQDRIVTAEVDFTFVNVGTGATDIRINLPYGSNIEAGVGNGSFYANATNALNVRVVSGKAIVLQADNNMFPGTPGSFRVRFEYSI